MTKFMLLYVAPVSADEQMMAATTPEERQKGMEPWMAWFAKYGAAILDGGTPLVKGMHFSKNESTKSQSHIGGYSIVEAPDMEAITSMIADHPHYMLPEGSIEVLQMMPMTA